MLSNEKDYLIKMIEAVDYDYDTFLVHFGENKVLFGVTSQEDTKESRFFVYKSIFDSVIDINRKVKYSLLTSIKILSEANLEHWNPIIPPSDSEKMAVYYIENALFRIETLWDLLAQIVNVKENLSTPQNRIYAKTIFNNVYQKNSNNVCKKDSKLFAEKVLKYMNQDDNTEKEKWEGNFSYVKNLRDKMTHRNSPNVSVMSNFDMNLRTPPIFMLKRIIEDYWQVSMFLKEYVENIAKDFEDVF